MKDRFRPLKAAALAFPLAFALAVPAGCSSSSAYDRYHAEEEGESGRSTTSTDEGYWQKLGQEQLKELQDRQRQDEEAQRAMQQDMPGAASSGSPEGHDDGYGYGQYDDGGQYGQPYGDGYGYGHDDYGQYYDDYYYYGYDDSDEEYQQYLDDQEQMHEEERQYYEDEQYYEDQRAYDDYYYGSQW